MHIEFFARTRSLSPYRYIARTIIRALKRITRESFSLLAEGAMFAIPAKNSVAENARTSAWRKVGKDDEEEEKEARSRSAPRVDVLTVAPRSFLGARARFDGFSYFAKSFTSSESERGRKVTRRESAKIDDATKREQKSI